jgi:hypothetical protein
VCGRTADVSCCGLCLDCIAEHARIERVAQGLAPTVTDPALLDRVATVLAPTSARPAA